MDTLDTLENKVALVILDFQEDLALQERVDIQDIVGLKDLKVSQDFQVSQVCQDLPRPLVTLERQDIADSQVNKDLMVYQVTLVTVE